MKKFALSVIGLAVLVGLVARPGPGAGDDPSAQAGASVEEDAWARAARESRSSTGNKASAVTSASLTDAPVTLEQRSGHYFASASVNGRSIDFLVDTGASLVALSEADARSAGIAFDKARFTHIGAGASGPVRGQIVTIESIDLRGKTVRNVRGAVLEGADMSLLGQSFLNEMRGIEISDGRMVIR